MAWSEAGRDALAGVLIALAAHAAPGARQEDVRIHGRVVLESGAPVRGASVVLNLPARSWTVSTDDSGAFDARGLWPGSYEIGVAKAGLLLYQTSRGMVRGATGALSIGLGPVQSGESRDAGTIVMRRASAIAGRVLDGFGEPVQGAIVSVSRVVYPSPGSKEFRAGKSGMTDDLGAYRIFGLEPGTYVVSASRNAPFVAVLREGATFVRTEPTAPAPTFYPSAKFASDAQPVRVATGEDRLAIDIVLVPAKFAQVSGRATTSNGQPAPDAMITLWRENGGQSYERAIRSDANGLFSIGGVAEGDYILFAGSREYLALVGQQGTANVTGSFESGAMPISVAGDVAGLEVRMSSGFDVRGRLLIDGKPPAIGPDQRLMITAIPAAPDGPSFSRSALVQTSGEFIMRGFPAGRLRLSALGLPPGAMIVRIALNGIDVTDEGLEVSGPLVGLEVSATTRPSAVSGTVTTAGERAPSRVVVFSDDARLWMLPNTRYVKLASTSLNGEFSIRGLPPGHYLAVAMAWMDPDTWADPANLQQLRNAATPFTMPESGNVTLNLVRR